MNVKSKNNLYIVVGEESSLMVEEIVQKLAGAASGPVEKIHFYPKETSAKNILQEFGNLSFTPRVFIFHDAGSFKKEEVSAVISSLDVLENDFSIIDYGPEITGAALKKDPIYKAVSAKAKMAGSPAAAAENFFFDLIDAIRRGRTASALKYFSGIVNEKNLKKSSIQGEILKLLKGMTTMLARTKSAKLKHAYLMSIFNSDRMLKESLMSPKIIIERMIVKMCSYSRTIK